MAQPKRQAQSKSEVRIWEGKPISRRTFGAPENFPDDWGKREDKEAWGALKNPRRFPAGGSYFRF